jgi:Ser/Thr protein kinase RdoA (MazF antagonist)
MFAGQFRSRFGCRDETLKLVVCHGETMQTSKHQMSLCRRWCATPPVRVDPLGSQGFSGSRVFVVEFADRPGRFVLKCFHATASRAHAAFVHDLVRHVRGDGVTQVPEVVPTLDGDTIVSDGEGRLWELARFLPGVAVPCPTPSQATAAATALARLHRAAARLATHPPRRDVSPGLARRIERARELRLRPWQASRAAWFPAVRERLPADLSAALEARVTAAIEVFTASDGDDFVARVAGMRPDGCVLQPVLRDVWCEHVLFAEGHRDDVTAIIDLHAAGIDTPATDLSRLVGSWIAPDGRARLPLLERWPEASAAYGMVRGLSAVEAALVPVLHATGILFGLDNWFRWTLDEHRDFSDPQRMLERIDRLLEELPAAIATAWSPAGNVD